MAMNEMDMDRMPDESMQMMDIKEEPMQDPIEIVKQDHRKVEGLFKQFEGTEDKRQKLELCKQICMELTVHAQYEEELIYPLLKKEDEDTEEEAEWEHELIKFMISELEGANARDKGLEPKVKVLKELVEHHVQEEEKDALPELEDSEELKSMTQQILDRKAQLMEQMQSGGRRGRSSSRGGTRGGSKTAARKSSGGRKTASTRKTTSSRSKKATSTRGGSKTQKSTAGKKGGSKSSTRSTSSRSKSTSASRTKSTRATAGKKTVAKKGGRTGSSSRSTKKSTGKRGR